jgi:hypothetical protein
MRDGEIGENEVNLEDLVILVNLVNRSDFSGT